MDKPKRSLPPAPRPYFLINNLQVAMIQGLEKELKPAGITPAAGRVLSAIARRPEISSAELAKMFGISPQGVKETITALEANGLVERFQAEDDRRVLRARLTEKGWDVREKHLDALGTMYQDVFRGLNDTEMMILVTLLQKTLETARPEAMEYYSDSRASNAETKP